MDTTAIASPSDTASATPPRTGRAASWQRLLAWWTALVATLEAGRLAPLVRAARAVRTATPGASIANPRLRAAWVAAVLTVPGLLTAWTIWTVGRLLFAWAVGTPLRPVADEA